MLEIGEVEIHRQLLTGIIVKDSIQSWWLENERFQVANDISQLTFRIERCRHSGNFIRELALFLACE